MNAHFPPACCESCGRPFQTRAAHGIWFDGTTMYFRQGEGVGYVKLTGLEAALLRFMSERFGQIVHRDRLYTYIWGQSETSAKILDVYACKLRVKLRGTPYTLKTQFAFGYGLVFREPRVESCESNHTTNPTQENAVHANQA